MRANGVRALLMGGQACVSYGAAEFSRDVDFAILASSANAAALRRALDDLQAEVIAVPPFDLTYLRRGHALHFRCHHPDVKGLRVDVMSRMRGVASFSRLWARRSTLELPGGLAIELMSLPDLVQAKKTQRDKDWPMVRRLVEAHYFQHRDRPSAAHVRFWMRELRTPELLVEVAGRHAASCRRMMTMRPLLRRALRGDVDGVEASLEAEERGERAADRRYWKPLRAELECLRHAR
jgi:hypothetical protein